MLLPGSKPRPSSHYTDSSIPHCTKCCRTVRSVFISTFPVAMLEILAPCTSVLDSPCSPINLRIFPLKKLIHLQCTSYKMAAHQQKMHNETQDRKRMYNVILRRVRVTTVAVEKKRVTYSECVSVALIIRHAKRVHSFVICGLSDSVAFLHIS